MNRVTRGTVVLAAAIAALSCKGDPTGDLRNGVDHLIALPSAIFLHPDSSKNVLVEAVDKQGNRLGTTFSLGNVGAGISVVPDDSFNLVYDTQGKLVPPKNWTRIQYIVSGVANDNNSSFVVTAGGKSLTIPVRLVPDTANTLTVNATAPALGDTVTATAGPNFKFTPASQVSLPGATVVTLGISADSTQIFFLAGPSGNGAISVSNMVVSYATSLGGYTGNSGGTTLTTPAVTSFPATYSNATPGPNDTVTVTLGAGFRFLPTATLTHGAGAAAFIISRAPDSSAISFVAFPGSAAGPMTANGVVLSFLTSVPLSIPSTGSITPAAPYAGTGAYATAPTVTLPGSGGSASVFDVTPFNNSADCNNVNAGGAPCRILKFTLASASVITFSNTWNSRADLGLYFANAALASFGGFGCDSKGNGGNAQPEVCTVTFPAGTYYMAQTTFAPFYGPPDNVDPTFYRIDISVQ